MSIEVNMKFFIIWETDKGEMKMPIKASNKKEALGVLSVMQVYAPDVDYILVMHNESGLPIILA